MNEPQVTPELAAEHGLTEEEYARMLEVLQRIPTYTELGIFSVMWSEHCSYKNSIAQLKTLPRSGGRLLVSAGEENAGLVDIGDGLAVAFKIESHNHPSAVEPYQGAATGVGGIMRDIFTMGARPIAALNSLRFGDPSLPRTKYLMRGIVKGIGDYGNSFGVPTVAGDVYFDKCYDGNPLVNAMSVGIVRTDQIATASAKGEGNVVLIVGSSTGRDGIHGATFASEEISEESEARRPAVQVGDPFTEKLLLEATLEAIAAGYVVGIQDMGAAGITCSTSEMSARGGSGMRIDLDRVPIRESNMTPYEIMLSESQERMLLVVRPEHESAVRTIFEKWDLACQRIGTVERTGKIEVWKAGGIVAQIPAESLVLGGGAPVYVREAREPEYLKKVRQLDPLSIGEPRNYTKTLERLIRSLNICSRGWISTQYDSMVRTNTVLHEKADAAVVRIKGTGKALALKTDCNARYVYLNPYVGAMIAVAECARNVVCVGGEPLAITNCLNFGNPYKPDVYWQFKEAVKGIGDACRALGTPVTGGNVSFYNESPDGPIHPTPVIGMLGEISDLERITTAAFKDAGDAVLLLGETAGHLGGSEYLKVEHDLVAGDAPPLNLKAEKSLQDALRAMISAGLVKSAHDLSEGGLGVALAECCIWSETSLGAEIKLETPLRLDHYLFGEDQSRVLISCTPEAVDEIRNLLKKDGVSCYQLGVVTRGTLRIGERIEMDVSRMREAYERQIPEMMKE